MSWSAEDIAAWEQARFGLESYAELWEPSEGAAALAIMDGVKEWATPGWWDDIVGGADVEPHPLSEAVLALQDALSTAAAAGTVPSTWAEWWAIDGEDILSFSAAMAAADQSVLDLAAAGALQVLTTLGDLGGGVAATAEGAREAGEAVKNNPIPAALGVAALYALWQALT